jgi:hypothetical protein
MRWTRTGGVFACDTEAGGETRNPKPEIRKKPEAQNPNVALVRPYLGFWFSSFIRISGFWFRVLRCPRLVLFLLITVPLSACDERSNTSSNAPTAVPATQPLALLNIDGQSVQFPPAKLVLTRDGGGMDAVLSSDDPPTGSDAANSFMFEMKLDAQEADDLPAIAWAFKAPDDQPQDSTSGILLAGGHRQLQPLDVKVTFQKQGDRILAKITGKLLAFDPQDSTASSATVDVNGTLDASVQEQN